MSTPIYAKQRLRAHKLLNQASDALRALRNERLNLSEETEKSVNDASQRVQDASNDLDCQPGA